MKQYDIGLDLGTTSIIIATQEQGVVFHQPSIGAVDTRSSTILAVGDKALRMVGRVPSYIDIIRPLRDGIIQDHRMTNELIVRFINEVCRSRIIKPRVSVCVPAAITGIEADAVVEAVMAAGARQVFLVDEPVAAADKAVKTAPVPRNAAVFRKPFLYRRRHLCGTRRFCRRKRISAVFSDIVGIGADRPAGDEGLFVCLDYFFHGFDP